MVSGITTTETKKYAHSLAPDQAAIQHNHFGSFTYHDDHQRLLAPPPLDEPPPQLPPEDDELDDELVDRSSLGMV